MNGPFGPNPATRPRGPERLGELEIEARHALDRYRLYRARAYGPRATSAARLRELERLSKLADSRFERARAGEEPPASE